MFWPSASLQKALASLRKASARLQKLSPKCFCHLQACRSFSPICLSCFISVISYAKFIYINRRGNKVLFDISRVPIIFHYVKSEVKSVPLVFEAINVRKRSDFFLRDLFILIKMNPHCSSALGNMRICSQETIERVCKWYCHNANIPIHTYSLNGLAVRTGMDMHRFNALCHDV